MLLGRLLGLAALVGLAVSVVILLAFVIPAILEGSSPILVASIGAGAIGFVVLYLARGFRGHTTVAVLGTLTGVGLILVLSSIWTPLARLSRLASESAFIVQAVEIDLAGLLLAGIVIGALGAIDDVAVTQTSGVWEIRAADPELDARGLFRSGMRVGRDHVGSIVNTLALAYAGASLPLLILFQLSGQPLGQLVGSEILATEIVRTWSARSDSSQRCRSRPGWRQPSPRARSVAIRSLSPRERRSRPTSTGPCIGCPCRPWLTA